MKTPALPLTDIFLAEGRCLPISDHAVVMAILNATPDSFSDGGRYIDPEAACAQALRWEADGAEIIDVGGESTRPGSSPVPAEEQRRRVVPVITAIRRQSTIPISVDTTSADVAEAALDAGADVINDISALCGDEAMLPLAVQRNAPVILMHMQGIPQTMQEAPSYGDVSADVRRFLLERCRVAQAAGLPAGRLIVDPGFGFGKTVAHNLELLAELDDLVAEGLPVLVGFSRKSTIGAVLDLPVEERLEGSLAVAVLAVEWGARLLRVHDVRETVRAVRMTEAILTAGAPKLERSES